MIVVQILVILMSILYLILVLRILFFRVEVLISLVIFIIITKFCMIKWWLWFMEWVNLASRRAIWLFSCDKLTLSYMNILVLSGQWIWSEETDHNLHPSLNKKYIIKYISGRFFSPFSFSSCILVHVFSNSLRLKLRLIIKMR